MLQGARDERGRLARYRSIVMPNLDKSGVQPGAKRQARCSASKRCLVGLGDDVASQSVAKVAVTWESADGNRQSNGGASDVE